MIGLHNNHDGNEHTAQEDGIAFISSLASVLRTAFILFHVLILVVMETETIRSLGVTGALLVATTAILWHWNKSRVTTLQLAALEDGGRQWKSPPIYTITHLLGDPSKSASYLKARVRKIVERNLWLGAWPSIRREHKVLMYRADSRKATDKCFKLYRDGEVRLGPVQSLEELNRLLQKHPTLLVKASNSDLLEHSDLPMWRVAVVTIDDGHFLLVVSMSHVLGDMATFNKILHMLSHEKQIETLDPRRRTIEILDIFSNLTFREWLHRAMREPETEKSQSVAFRLSKDWINKQKQRALAEAVNLTFVSTNDVLSSWFFRTTKCDLGLIFFDLRGRVKSLSLNFAGNYVRILAFTPSEFVSPLTVRQFLTQLSHAANSPAPTFSDESVIGAVDNLVAGDRDDLRVPCCTAEWQIPLFLFSSRPRTTSARIPVMYVFRCGPGMQVGAKVEASQDIILQIKKSKMVDSFLTLPVWFAHEDQHQHATPEQKSAPFFSPKAETTIV